MIRTQRGSYQFRSAAAGRARRGAIFVTTLVVIAILSGMLLAFASNMRTEAISSANRVSAAQADAIELGAEQYVLASIEAQPGDAVEITTNVDGEAVRIGTGYFWLLSSDPQTDQQYAFGIVDECGKINLNNATTNGNYNLDALAQLESLPGMSDELAEPILDWIGNGPQPNGAQSDYYNGLAIPYDMKNDTLETVEELNLLKNETGTSWNELLCGLDANRNGVVEPGEQAAGGGVNLNFGDQASGSRGMFNDVTVYSFDPNTDAAGNGLQNVNRAWQSSGSGGNGGPPRIDPTLLGDFFRQYGVTADPGKTADSLTNYLQKNNNRFLDLYSFYRASRLSSQDFALIADEIRAPRNRRAVNVNTASQDVLYALAAATDGVVTTADMDELISARVGGADLSSVGWVFDTLAPPGSKGGSPGADKCRALAPLITTRSFQYSADIVAVSGDGRSFKRVRIVVDSSTIPAKIIYRRELSSLGWPLPPEIRASLQAGRGIPSGDRSGSGTAGQSHF